MVVVVVVVVGWLYSALCCCLLSFLLLLASPDDDHAGGVGGGKQRLVAVEADVQHRATVALQLVDDGLGVTLHVKEVHARVLAARHCMEDTQLNVGYM